jgi:hypothetical protein
LVKSTGEKREKEQSRFRKIKEDGDSGGYEGMKRRKNEKKGEICLKRL